MGHRFRHRRLVLRGAAALTAGASTLSPAAAGAPPAAEAAPAPSPAPSPADGSGTLPPLPSASDLAAVRGLTSVDGLADALRQRFPDTFAGYRADPAGGFTILTSGPATSLRAFVSDTRAGLAAEDGRVARVSPPRVTYATVTHSLQALEALEARVEADLPALAADGVTGLTVDEAHNAVSVLVESPQPGLADRLAATYGTDALRVVATGRVQLADRISDVPPWNAGNQLVNLDGGGCTSGPAMHDDAGNTFGTTAGHCGDSIFFNTSYTAPSFSPDRQVGGTINNPSLHGFPGADAELIGGATSNLFWKSGGGSLSRQWVAGAAAPAVGMNICSEGSFGFEKCGQIQDVNFQVETGAVTFLYTGQCPIPGDSGGPIIWPTQYGYVMVGLVLGSLINPIDGSEVACLGTSVMDAAFWLHVTPSSLTT